MAKPVTYLIPVGTVRIEQEVKRSRFIAQLGRAENRQAALAFIHAVRNADSGANHHCWAFIAGNPADGRVLGQSDAGEPNGTAGRPILNTLQHSGIGEVVAVVSRYFGGIKLGTGGLVRAYSGAVQHALKGLLCEPFIERSEYLICLPFAFESAVRRILADLQLEISQTGYNDMVTLEVAVPTDRRVELDKKLRDCCRGQASIQPKEK